MRPKKEDFFLVCLSSSAAVFNKYKSLQKVGPFFRYSVFMAISVFRSSHTKPKSFKIAQISAVLLQIQVIALKIPTYGGEAVSRENSGFVKRKLHLLIHYAYDPHCHPS